LKFKFENEFVGGKFDYAIPNPSNGTKVMRLPVRRKEGYILTWITPNLNKPPDMLQNPMRHNPRNGMSACEKKIGKYTKLDNT
jgi:hypothetical protein